MLKNRIQTGVFLAVVICLTVLGSHIPRFLNPILAAISMMGAYEILRSTGHLCSRVLFLVSSLMAIWITFFSFSSEALCASILCMVFSVIIFVYLIYQVGKRNTLPLGIVIAVLLFIPLSLKTMAFIRGEEQGFILLIFAILTSSFTDIAAYFIGSRWGRRPLAPTISPRKTVGGSFGGTAVTMAVLLVLALVLDRLDAVNVDCLCLAVYLFRASLIGQIGDLAFSSIKRIVGVKDFGAILPGHGGILDRFDSMLFILPFTYVFEHVYGPIFF